jgi:hypothetical protein
MGRLAQRGAERVDVVVSRRKVDYGEQSSILRRDASAAKS